MQELAWPNPRDGFSNDQGRKARNETAWESVTWQQRVREGSLILEADVHVLNNECHETQ